MTLGQRIQAERKRLGLSQEGLGEALGVTRQAISKWEADGAVPEVDKLVALSRLFHLPVGVLLGVEEAAAAEPPRPVPRWKRRLWPLLSAALGAVCVVLVLRVNTLQSGQADRLLAAALADGRMWQVEERGVAALGEDGTFCWRLRAVPEVEAPGLGLSVTAEGGGERFTARADRDGLAYEAELRLPLGEEYHFTLRTRTPSGAEMVAILEGRDPALADNFPDPDGKGTAGPPAEPVSDPIPLSGGEPQPPDGGGMEFGPEGKPKE